ncbi:MAG TPA: O-antigen ligase family protein [Dissulfurispiraceae bacterium]
MLWMTVGYLFLFIFRPWEYWPALAPYRIERVYMLFLLALVFMWRQRRYVPHRVTRWIIAFFLVLGLSTIMAFRWGDAYEAWFDYFKLIVFYFVIIMTVRDEKDLKRFITAYILIMFIYVGKSAWEFFFHDRYIWRMGLRRLMGVDISYGDPNALAASIAYSLPFLWALIKYGLERPLLRKALWAYGILAWVSIIYTGSRSGMVTALLFVALAWLGASRKVMSVLAVGMVLFLTWNFMPVKYQVRFESTFIKGISPKGTDESAQGRIEGLKQGLRTFARYPVFGIGPGNFKYSWSKYELGGSAHNLYGELLGETGGAGFVVFFTLVVLIVKTHKAVIRKTGLLLADVRSGTPQEEVRKWRMLHLVATASVQAVILLLFNGNFGHNLYRYNWLWIGAIGVLSAYFLKDTSVRVSAVYRIEPRRQGPAGFNVLPEEN